MHRLPYNTARAALGGGWRHCICGSTRYATQYALQLSAHWPRSKALRRRYAAGEIQGDERVCHHERHTRLAEVTVDRSVSPPLLYVSWRQKHRRYRSTSLSPRLYRSRTLTARSCSLWMTKIKRLSREEYGSKTRWKAGESGNADTQWAPGTSGSKETQWAPGTSAAKKRSGCFADGLAKKATNKLTHH
jgi:hypothetical protein